jgi:hypothetical protein
MCQPVGYRIQHIFDHPVVVQLLSFLQELQQVVGVIRGNRSSFVLDVPIQPLVHA